MSPEQQPPRTPHPEMVGEVLSSVTYEFNVGFNAACSDLFLADATLPARSSLRFPETERLAERRERYHRTIQQLLLKSEHQAKGLMSEVLAVGMRTKVRVEQTRSSISMVPFVAAQVPMDDSDSVAAQPTHLLLGVYFPRFKSFSLSPVGIPHSVITRPEHATALVKALQWIEIVERLHSFSPEINAAAQRFVYEDRESNLLKSATGQEVLSEAKLREIPDFVTAFSRARACDLRLSELEIYRGIKKGVVPRCSGVEEIYSFYENARPDHRRLSPAAAAVVALVSAKRFKLLWRHSMEDVQAKDRRALPLIAAVADGVRKLREITVGVGSRLGVFMDEMDHCLRGIDSLRAVTMLQTAYDNPGPLARLDEILKHSREHLEKLERLPAAPAKLPRDRFLDTLKHLHGAEQGLVEVVRQMEFVARIVGSEQDLDSAQDLVLSVRVQAIRTLRAFRIAVNECFPDLFEFKNESDSSLLA